MHALSFEPVESAWVMEIQAVSAVEPSRLLQTLTGAILGCGGWVLSRGISDAGMVSMLVQFQRKACIDIYSLLVGAGIELSFNSHRRFTELCHCTRSGDSRCEVEIASIDLEIETFAGMEQAPVRSGSRMNLTEEG